MGNSVIYRPAYDAEVEYLESTGTQWIDTGVKPDNTYTFDCKVAVTQDNYNCVYWGTRNSGNSKSENNQCYLNSNDKNTSDRFQTINLYSTTTAASSNWSSNIIPSVNTMYELTGMTVVPTMNTMIYPITLFAFNNIGNVNVGIGKCRIGYWKCYSNGQIIRDFIPVRIGSTGYMYDKVSKQLFANKGTGNFILGNDVPNAVIPQQRCVLYFGSQRSVIYDRIYEEYEWLCGRNGAYINTEYELTPFDDAFYVKARYDGSIKNPDNDEQYVFGMRNYVSSTDRYYCVTLISAQNKIAPRYCNLGSANPVTDKATNFEVFLSADTNYMYRTLNGVAYPAYSHDGTFVLKSDKAIYLFKANFTDSPQNAVNKYFHGDIAYFKITDTSSNVKMHLIPCKLLQPIPAILDGNGIARQAGECGMWDKVSNRFYGNVANSGSFTVLNN